MNWTIIVMGAIIGGATGAFGASRGWSTTVTLTLALVAYLVIAIPLLFGPLAWALIAVPS